MRTVISVSQKELFESVLKSFVERPGRRHECFNFRQPIIPCGGGGGVHFAEFLAVIHLALSGTGPAPPMRPRDVRPVKSGQLSVHDCVTKMKDFLSRAYSFSVKFGDRDSGENVTSSKCTRRICYVAKTSSCETAQSRNVLL